ncbi:hypothetical protein J6590_064303 [Homalodisca vitripennis]|nr:hypothetical protein J6590_064303 [Homalodisca vitripennis]
MATVATRRPRSEDKQSPYPWGYDVGNKLQPASAAFIPTHIPSRHGRVGSDSHLRYTCTSCTYSNNASPSHCSPQGLTRFPTLQQRQAVKAGFSGDCHSQARNKTTATDKRQRQSP